MMSSESCALGRAFRTVSHDEWKDVPRGSVTSESDAHSYLSLSHLAPSQYSVTYRHETLRREQRLRRDPEDESDFLTSSFRNGSGRRSPVKGLHDISPSIIDSDSGISNTFHQPLSRAPYTSDYDDMLNRSGYTSPTPTMRTKSRTYSAGSPLPTSGRASPIKGVDKTLRDLQDTLRDSESRRNLLMSKLKEAQDTIMLQSKRLDTSIDIKKEPPMVNKIEIAELQARKKEYMTRIDHLEKDRDHQQRFTLESSKLRHTMQERMDSLDLELRSIKSQYNLLQVEHRKRLEILDQTSNAMSLLEEENAKLVKAKDSQTKELVALRESLHIARNRNEVIEDQMKDIKHDVDRLREENHLLTTQNIQLTQQASEIRNTHAELKMETNQLIESVKALGDEKQKLLQKVHSYHDAVEDMRSNLSSVSADKERFFQEKLDLHQRVQTLNLEKDRCHKENVSLEEQLNEANADLAHIKLQVDKKTEEKRRIQDELEAVKKVGEVLSTELSGTKSALEEAQEQVTSLQSAKKLAQQQHSIYEQEVKSLQEQLETMRKTVDTMRKDHSKEKEQFDQQNIQLKEEIRKMKQEKYDMENHSYEVESKLKVLTNELETKTKLHESEVDSWRKQCEKLRDALEQKDASLQQCSLTIDELQEQSIQLKEDHDNAQVLYDEVLGIKEEMQRLHDENEQLHQERTENQQIIQLLEMQKNILTKTTENGLGRAETDALQCQVDQLSAENSLLQDKIKGLERVRDELIDQKEGLLVNSHSDLTSRVASSQGEAATAMPSTQMVLNTPPVGDLEKQNQQLRNLNDMITERLNKLEKENMQLKQLTGQDEEMVSKSEFKRVEREKQMLDVNYKQLKSDYDALEEAHHKFLIGDKNAPKKDPIVTNPSPAKNNDKEESQVALLNGQIVLLENSKKRLEDQVEKLQRELAQVKERLAALSENDGDNDTELYHLRREISKLKMELEDSQNIQNKQEALLKSYKEELDDERTKKPTRIKQSLEDVEWELSTMRTELQKLLEVIQMKDHEIEGLETQLKASQDEAKNREKMIHDLQVKSRHDTGLTCKSPTILEEKVASLENDKVKMAERIKQLESERFELDVKINRLSQDVNCHDTEKNILPTERMMKESQLLGALEKEKHKQSEKQGTRTPSGGKRLDIVDNQWYYWDSFEERNMIPNKSPESDYGGEADTEESITEQLASQQNDSLNDDDGDGLELKDSRLHHAMKGSIPALVPSGMITPFSDKSSFSSPNKSGNNSYLSSPERSPRKPTTALADHALSPAKSLMDEMQEEERAATPGLLSELDPLARAPPSEDGDDDMDQDLPGLLRSEDDSANNTLTSTPTKQSPFRGAPSPSRLKPIQSPSRPTKSTNPPWR